ncbi:MAG: hypothetical protein ABSA52_17990 [Candidatus Binatia bacterium]|jgi:hypothetical protein
MESIKRILVREIRGPETTHTEPVYYFTLIVDLDRAEPFKVEAAAVVVCVDQDDAWELAEGAGTNFRSPDNVKRVQARLVQHVYKHAGRILADGPAPVSYRSRLASTEVSELLAVDPGRVRIGEWVSVDSPRILGFVK